MKSSRLWRDSLLEWQQLRVSELPEGQHDVHRGDRVQYDVDPDRYKPDKMRAVRVSFINGEAK